MTSNDYSFPSNGAFETGSDENQRPTMEETASILEENRFAQIWCQSLWSTPNDHESTQEATYVAEPVTLTELEPFNSFASYQPAPYYQQQPQCSMPSPSQLAQPVPPQEWPQYAMPPLPLYSDALPLTPPSDPRSQLKVIRPVAKKQGAAPRAKPYTPGASKQRKPKATAPPQPEFQPFQSVPNAEVTAPPQSAVPQPPPSAETNAPKLTILSPDNIRAISFDTTGRDFPNVLQQNNTIKAVTNVPEDPAYPVVQLMSNGTDTLPVLVYDGTRVEMPIYKHDFNNVRVNLDKPLPRAPTQEPVIVTFIFENDFMTSIKVYLN